MSDERQIARLLDAADEALVGYRKTKTGGSLSDPEAAAVRDLSRFWLAYDEGEKDGQMVQYIGVATLHELELRLKKENGVDAGSKRIRLHTHNLARKARQLAVQQRKVELDDALRLRSVQKEPTTADTGDGTDPVRFEDMGGVQWFGKHEADS